MKASATIILLRHGCDPLHERSPVFTPSADTYPEIRHSWMTNNFRSWGGSGLTKLHAFAACETIWTQGLNVPNNIMLCAHISFFISQPNTIAKSRQKSSQIRYDMGLTWNWRFTLIIYNTNMPNNSLKVVHIKCRFSYSDSAPGALQQKKLLDQTHLIAKFCMQNPNRCAPTLILRK